MARKTLAPENRVEKTIDNINEKFIQVFSKAQETSSAPAHVANAELLKRVHLDCVANKTGQEFTNIFVEYIARVLAHYPREIAADHCIVFITTYLERVAIHVHQDDSVKQEFAEFMDSIMQIYYSGFKSKIREVRQRIVRLSCAALSSDHISPVLDSHTEEKLVLKLFDRSMDQDAKIRGLVINCLRQGDASYRDRVVKLFTEMCRTDPNVDIRIKSLFLLKGQYGPEEDSNFEAITIMKDPQEFVDLVVERTRDPSGAARAHAFSILCDPRIDISKFTRDSDGQLGQRTLLLEGLSDDAQAVRNAAWNLVINWMNSLNNNMFDMITELDVLPDTGDLTNFEQAAPAKEKFMQCMFEREESVRSLDLKPYLKMDMQPELAFHIRCFSQFCLKKYTHLREKNLPGLVDFIKFLKPYWEHLVSLEKDDKDKSGEKEKQKEATDIAAGDIPNQELDMHEDETTEHPVDKLEQALMASYIFGQLIQTIDHFDLDDEQGRRLLLNTVEVILASPRMVSAHVPRVMKLLRKTFPSDADFIARSTELLSTVEGTTLSEEWDAQLYLIEGTLINIKNIDDEAYFDVLREPVERCFSLEGNYYDVRESATKILGLLALASERHAHEILDTLVKNYRDIERQMEVDADELQKEIKYVQEKLNSARAGRIRDELRKELDDLENTAIGWESFPERLLITQVLTDVMQQHGFAHKDGIEILKEGSLSQDNRELSASCTYALTKLLFCNIGYEPAILEELVMHFFDNKQTSRAPTLIDGRSFFSLLDIVEFFFRNYTRTVEQITNITSVFCRAVFKRFEELAADISESQTSAVYDASMSFVDLEESFDQSVVSTYWDKENIECVIKVTSQMLGELIKLTDPQKLVPKRPELGVQAFIIRDILQELVHICPLIAKESKTFSSLGKDKRGAINVGKNDSFYRVYYSFGNILFDRVREVTFSGIVKRPVLAEIRDLAQELLSTQRVFNKTRQAQIRAIGKEADELIAALDAGRQSLNVQPFPERAQEEDESHIYDIPMTPSNERPEPQKSPQGLEDDSNLSIASGFGSPKPIKIRKRPRVPPVDAESSVEYNDSMTPTGSPQDPRKRHRDEEDDDDIPSD